MKALKVIGIVMLYTLGLALVLGWGIMRIMLSILFRVPLIPAIPFFIMGAGADRVRVTRVS